MQIVTQAALPVDEMLTIGKQRFGAGDKRISIVTGIHGDELEGQYVCYELARRLNEQPQNLKGIVDIYPALNPNGLDSWMRGIPAFDLDMNRIFPGSSDGDMNEYIASQIVEDIVGSDVCLDIHASNIYLTEIPQIRINELHKDVLVPLAEKANVDFIWVHGAATVLESTLAYSLNSRGVNTLVVEMGVGMRITKEFGNQLVDGILNIMKNMRIWEGETTEVRKPVISSAPDDVSFLNAKRSGVFIKEKDAGSLVKKGEIVGLLVDPPTGKILDDVTSPVDGWLFTVREYPMVSEGSLMGRVLCEETYMRGRSAL